MNPFHELFQRTKSSRFYDEFLKEATPLGDAYGINHFWYYRITHTGHYSYIGTHTKWDEFSFGEMSIEDMQECMRTISASKGLQLMQSYTANNEVVKDAFTVAKNKFKLYHSLNFSYSTLLGVEGYGFGTYLNGPQADELLLNHHQPLQYFAQNLQKKKKIITRLLDESPVDLVSLYGNDYKGPVEPVRSPHGHKKFLKHLGFESVLSLKPRELEILSFMRYGYSASYIAKKTKRNRRTVENSIAEMKITLACSSKHQLIDLAKEADAAGLFNLPHFSTPTSL